MYFPRWVLEKVATDMATESNDSSYIPGSLEMYGGSTSTVIPDQSEGADFEPERQLNVKDRVSILKAMFARPDEIAPTLRGDFSHEEAMKSKVASRVGRIAF